MHTNGKTLWKSPWNGWAWRHGQSRIAEQCVQNSILADTTKSIFLISMRILSLHQLWFDGRLHYFTRFLIISFRLQRFSPATPLALWRVRCEWAQTSINHLIKYDTIDGNNFWSVKLYFHTRHRRRRTKSTEVSELKSTFTFRFLRLRILTQNYLESVWLQHGFVVRIESAVRVLFHVSFASPNGCIHTDSGFDWEQYPVLTIRFQFFLYVFALDLLDVNETLFGAKVFAFLTRTRWATRLWWVDIVSYATDDRCSDLAMSSMVRHMCLTIWHGTYVVRHCVVEPMSSITKNDDWCRDVWWHNRHGNKFESSGAFVPKIEMFKGIITECHLHTVRRPTNLERCCCWLCGMSMCTSSWISVTEYGLRRTPPTSSCTKKSIEINTRLRFSSRRLEIVLL